MIAIFSPQQAFLFYNASIFSNNCNQREALKVESWTSVKPDKASANGTSFTSIWKYKNNEKPIFKLDIGISYITTI